MPHRMSAADNLHAVRTRFGGSAARHKLGALRATAAEPLTNPRDLRAYHDTLLFLCAYPDDRHVLAESRRELRRVERAARDITAGANQRRAEALANSGIAGTVVRCTYSIDAATWLLGRFGPDVDLAWEDGSAGDALDEFLPSLVSRAERDGLLCDQLTTRAWLDLAAGGRPGGGLAWLLEQCRRVGGSNEVGDRVFDSLELEFQWTLRDRAASRTWIRFLGGATFYQGAELRRSISMAEIVAQPLPPPARLTAGETTSLLDACRATLCVRLRETDTVTYANPREVTLFRLERGVQVALFGMRPERRLSIESYFGFVVARNRVPVGYGGGWVLGGASEIGVNIFDSFRGGESAFIFAQVLRTYRQHYGATRFAVDPYQFGAGNAEAIRSGAFWFYHRLGFRPTASHLAALAEQEAAHIGAARSYRSPPSVLRRLARSDLVFDLDPDRGTQPIDVKRVGLAVTEYVGRTYDGDRNAAERDATRRVRRLLDAGDINAWPKPEQATFRYLAVLVGMIHELRTWPASDRRSLALLMRSKGGPREATYARRLRRHGRFIGALRDLAQAGRGIK